jgi:putative NIF3 family GTP cyclohydrolase 1 type 2
LRIFHQTRDSFEVVSGPEHDQRCKSVLASQAGDDIFVLSQELDQPSEILGFGFVGDLPQPQPWDDFVRSLRNILGLPLRRLAGEIPDTVRRIACCPGSGASFVQRAAQTQAQVFLTGDLKYHDAQAVQDYGLLVVDVGHFILEERMMRILATQLQAQLRDFSVEVAFFQGRDAFTHVE